MSNMILETYIRVFVERDKLETTISFYMSLLNGKKTLQFSYPEAGLEIAGVSSESLSVLIIAGDAEKRAPFEQTRLTIKVSRVDNYIHILKDGGSTQLEEVQKTPVGHKTRFRHPDGLVIEYVDHDRDVSGD